MKKFLVFTTIISCIMLFFTISVSAATYLWPAPGVSYISQYYSNGHPGIDIAANGDHEIVAAREGTVIASASTSCTHISQSGDNCNYGMGNYVQIKHSDGSYATYMHMRYGSITVSVGQYISRGTKVGMMGSSGNSTGQHLHFQVGYSTSDTINVNPDTLGYDYNDQPTNPPSNAWITADNTCIEKGQSVNFNFGIENVVHAGIGIDKNGSRYHTIDATGTSSASYTFNETGTYSIVCEGYNSLGEMGYSNWLTINVYEQGYAPLDIGTDFKAVILNTAYWKPITCCDDGYVRLETEHGTASQVWKFWRESDGSYIIKSAQNGKVLDVYSGGNEDGLPIHTYENEGNDNQRWFIHRQGNGYVLRPRNSSNRVMDLNENYSDDGTKIQLWNRHNGDSQIFSIYTGDEIQLKGPNLSVVTGLSDSDTAFSWNSVYGGKRYDLKIWKNKIWEGDAYYVKWDATIPFNIVLPAGHYEAYIDATNEVQGEMSNVVAFDIPETQGINSYETSMTKSEDNVLLNIERKTNGTYPLQVMVAFYDSNHKLVKSQLEIIEMNNQQEIYNYTIPINNSIAAYAKAFVWQRNSLLPLSQVTPLQLD